VIRCRPVLPRPLAAAVLAAAALLATAACAAPAVAAGPPVRVLDETRMRAFTDTALAELATSSNDSARVLAAEPDVPLHGAVTTYRAALETDGRRYCSHLVAGTAVTPERAVSLTYPQQDPQSRQSVRLAALAGELLCPAVAAR
jgi:hypothetical protein